MKTTRDTLIKACYQYLLDHAIPSDKGPIISFLLVNESTFKRRVLAREKGFKRINKEEIVENSLEYREKLPFVKAAKKQVQKFKKHQIKVDAITKMRNTGTLVEKTAIKFNERLKKFINKRSKKYVDNSPTNT